jgi:hypothetical protein
MTIRRAFIMNDLNNLLDNTEENIFNLYGTPDPEFAKRSQKEDDDFGDEEFDDEEDDFEDDVDDEVEDELMRRKL